VDSSRERRYPVKASSSVASSVPRIARWTDEELALLGTLPDYDLAALIGRTVEAVRLRRTRQGIPPARDRRKKWK
jgi:hypothetical protein